MAMQRNIMEINVYTISDCPKCEVAKEYLKANDLAFTELDVSKDKQAAKNMIVKTGQKKVPVIDIDGALVIGFDQEKLEELLGL